MITLSAGNKITMNLDELLSELLNNCGDNLGRDGTYLSEQVVRIIEALEKEREIQAEIEAGED